MSELLGARPELAEHISEIVAERQLRNERTIAEASKPPPEEVKATVRRQVMARMKAFFKEVL